MRVKMSSVFKVTVIYLSFGLLWIYLSDMTLNVFFKEDVSQLSKVQTIKGFFYVSFTALLLFVLMNRYSKQLKDRISRLKQSEKELTASDERYRRLFEFNPQPIWIYDPESLRILNVNKAAIDHYGYTRNEFLSMTEKDIEPENDIPELEEKLKLTATEDYLNEVFWHKKKNNEVIYVNTHTTTIDYNGVKAHMVTSNDITSQLNYIEAIEKQNAKLSEIAWMQSHVVRAPLASLMGLMHLMEDKCKDDAESKELLHKILDSASELDNVIKEISENTKQVELLKTK